MCFCLLLKSKDERQRIKNENIQMCSEFTARFGKATAYMNSIFNSHSDQVIDLDTQNHLTNSCTPLIKEAHVSSKHMLRFTKEFQEFHKALKEFELFSRNLLSKIVKHNQIIMDTQYCDELSTRLINAQMELDNWFSVRCKDLVDIRLAQELLDSMKPLKLQSDTAITNLKKSKTLQRLIKENASFKQASSRFIDRVKNNNERIIKLRITEAKQLIGTVEGIELDEQQLRSIVLMPRNHLVLAAAGTGKTTTVVGKIEYILKKKLLKPEDILVLSFTNASATEMDERIKKETGFNIDASTFHKLGLNILTKANGVVPTITTLSMYHFIKEQLIANMKDPKYFRTLGSYLLFNRVATKSEFDFTSADEYKEYIRLNPPQTVNGENVKSYGEMEIANFLYQNGIKYVYENHYEIDTATDQYAQYNPDFYLPDYNIYIEYFGINKNGEVPEFFCGRDGLSASETYKRSMEWKRRTHEENGTKLIECYSFEKMDGTLLDELQAKLEANNVEFNPISNEELWEQIAEDKDYTIDTLIELIETIINLIKSNRYTLDDVRNLNTNGYSKKDNNILLSIVEPIFNAYCSYLSKNNEIDFNDMINLAIDAINDGKYQHNYKLVIVDEYQDISKSRFLLLESMRKQRDYDLFCVGDDWQSIYRFAGSDISYILNFEKYWGMSEISKIETTYRFPQQLTDISSRFIMKNPEQIKKSIKSHVESIGFPVGEICGYTDEYAVKFMAERIKESPRNSTVYFIGRYTFDSKILENGDLFKCKYNNSSGLVDVFYQGRKDLKMNFLTAHKSKGLQADYVFIINNKSGRMGFPSQIQNSPIIDLLLEDGDSYPLAEERRLFYVALTRARKKAILMTIDNQKSEFFDELYNRHGKQMRRESFECPRCGGNLERKSGKYGEFWGCSNYRESGCKFIRNIPNHNE